MDLARAAKFGLIGATGTVLIQLGTIGLARVAWADRLAGAEGKAMNTVALIGIVGVAVTIVFLFVVIGEYVDRELAERGLDPDEE